MKGKAKILGRQLDDMMMKKRMKSRQSLATAWRIKSFSKSKLKLKGKPEIWRRQMNGMLMIMKKKKKKMKKMTKMKKK